jgi:hypothetical protein
MRSDLCTLLLMLAVAPNAVGAIITGADTGGNAHVKLFPSSGGSEVASFFAYPGFTGGVRVASGDVDGDGVADVITSAGPGGGPHVKVFNGQTGAETMSFFATTPSFAGGIFVAGGDVDNDGFADIVTGTDEGVATEVRVFTGTTPNLLLSFNPYGTSFTGGVRVATGDIDGDGALEIITGAGPGAGPHVKIFEGATGAERDGFFSYDSTFAGGIYVAAGDIDGDGFDDIVTGAGDGSSHVKVFSGQDGSELHSFFAYAGFTGGVRVAAGDVNGDGLADIITGTGLGAGPHVKIFDGATGAEIQSYFAYNPMFEGGIFVGYRPDPTVIPEPSTVVILGVAASFITLWSKRRLQ